MTTAAAKEPKNPPESDELVSPRPEPHAAHPLLGRTTRVMLSMLAVLAIPYAHRSMRALRVVPAPWDPVDPAAQTVAAPSSTPRVGDTKLRASENQATVTNALPEKSAATPLDPAVLARLAGTIAVEDPTGHALDAFYTELAKTARKEPHAVTRVLHYGDSVITSDYISGTLRRRFQGRFGDAGHGFIVIANPWEWYFHNDVVHGASDGWSANRIVGPLVGDGMYGLGLVSFHTTGAANAFFGTPDKGEFGRAVSRFDVYYLEHPAGGDVLAVVPGREAERFATRGPKKVSRVRSIEVADGKSQLSLRTWGNGDARLFGVVLERDVPGVTVDALGSNGARARLLLAMNDAHWAEQMALRKPALVVLQYGTNESEDGSAGADYEKGFGEVLEKVKAAAPGASVLVAATVDRAEKASNGELRTRPVIEQLVAAQRKVALEHKAAFFNTFEAMGGKGSVARWVKASPQLASWDLTHPTPAGAELLGDLFFKALMAGFEASEGANRRAAP